MKETVSQFSVFDDMLNDCCFIPVGYRCNTAQILKKFKLMTKSLPFDTGYFPPESVARVIKSQNMQLVYDKHGKFGNVKLCEIIPGGGFKTTTENKLHKKIEDEGPSIKLLGGNGGYYSCHTEHYYMLAHYLWHESSPIYKTDYKNVILEVSEMFQRRLKRVNELCNTYNNRFFIYYIGVPAPVNTLTIDNVDHDLTDMSLLKNQLNESFGENTLLCFTHNKKIDTNGIFYFDYTEYENFCQYVSDKKNT